MITYGYTDNDSFVETHYHDISSLPGNYSGPAMFVYNKNGLKNYEGWIVDGMFHRKDAPARIFAKGVVEYWTYNVYIRSEHDGQLRPC